jgi:DNA-nicking Smr family endonuclease
VGQVHLGPRLRGDERDRDAISKPNQSPRSPAPIEPLRKRRIARERDPIEARLDLHGLDQDRARVALHDFLQRAYGQGLRAVLVITGKGALGDGVLRRRTPDWLSEPAVRPLIAGVSPAERRHGGEGALYIALKRNRP